MISVSSIAVKNPQASGQPNIRREIAFGIRTSTISISGFISRPAWNRVMKKGGEEEKSEIARFYDMDRQISEKYARRIRIV